MTKHRIIVFPHFTPLELIGTHWSPLGTFWVLGKIPGKARSGLGRKGSRKGQVMAWEGSRKGC